MTLFGKILYGAAVRLARLWLHICGCKVIGREHIPADPSLLVIANHTSFADPVILAALLPYHITFIAKEAFGRKPFTSWLFGSVGVVFLNKEESDLSALRTSIKLLKQGRAVSIFPEGRRNRDQVLGSFMPGAGFMALKTGVPVLPMAIINSVNMRYFWRRKMVVHIGPPETYTAQGKVDHESVAELTEQLRQRVAGLQEKNVHFLNEGR